MPRYRVHTAYTTPLANYVDAYSGFPRGYAVLPGVTGGRNTCHACQPLPVVWYMSNPVTPPNRGPRTRLMF